MGNYSSFYSDFKPLSPGLQIMIRGAAELRKSKSTSVPRSIRDVSCVQPAGINPEQCHVGGCQN